MAPLQQLSLEAETSSDILNKIRDIEQSTLQLLTTIDHLLNLSKIYQGKMESVLSTGDLGASLADHISHFKEKAAAKTITIAFTRSLEGVYSFDADKWKKICSILLSNAIKNASKGDRIRISLKSTRSTLQTCRVEMAVTTPNGRISESSQLNIYDHFYQAHGLPETLPEGTDVGLILIKALTELMDGEMTADTTPGKGLTLRIMIPVAAAGDEGSLLTRGWPPPSIASKRVPVSSLPRESRRQDSLILLAEDSRQLNTLISRILKERYRVLTVHNLAEASEIARRELPDLIISGTLASGTGGFALCDKIKSTPLTAHIPFILLSTRESHEHAVKRVRHYADDYLAKPLQIEQLQMRIASILDRRQNLNDNYHQQLEAPTQPLSESEEEQHFVKRLYDIIEAHLGDARMDVGTLAEKMHLSRRTLNRKLNAIAHISAHQAIRQYRLKRAAALLKGKVTVAETAYRVGYETPSYFSAVFKSFYGVPPSEYANDLNRQNCIEVRNEISQQRTNRTKHRQDSHSGKQENNPDTAKVIV